MKRLKLTGPALLVALLISWPALQQGLIDDTMPMQSMLIRVGIAIALVMVARAFLSSVIDSYRLQNILRRSQRQDGLSDAPDGDGPPRT